MCHLLEFKCGTLNKWGTRLHYQQPKESFSLMFVCAPRSIQYIFALDCKTRRLCVHVCLNSHSTCHRAAYWVENQDWDERWKEKEYEMQKGPFCTSVLSAFSTVLHLRPEWSQWELSLVIQPPATQPYFNFLVTTGPDMVCIVTKEVSSVTIACSIFDITTILKQVDILGWILGISPSECA